MINCTDKHLQEYTLSILEQCVKSREQSREMDRLIKRLKASLRSDYSCISAYPTEQDELKGNITNLKRIALDNRPHFIPITIQSCSLYGKSIVMQYKS